MENQNFVISPLAEKDLVETGDVIKRTLLPVLKSQNLSEKVTEEILGRYDLDKFTDLIKGKYFFVVKDRQKIVGIGGLKKDDESQIPNRLTTFFVDPDYQGKGVGRMLYERVRKEAVKQGCNKLVVSSSPVAEKIYEHFGFKKVRIDWKEYPNGSKSYNIWMEQAL